MIDGTVEPARMKMRQDYDHIREAEVIIRWAVSAEYHDKDVVLHLRRVAASAAVIGQRMELPTAAIRDLQLAALLHDIGKVGLPDAILLKKEKFSDAEYAMMQGHTLIGARVLAGSDVPMLHVAQEIAEMHHERWDGAGYPKGLAGEQIGLYARIVTVADVLDALLTERSYRSAFSEMDALRTMSAGRGTIFDPHIFDCMIEVYQELRDARARVRVNCADVSSSHQQGQSQRSRLFPEMELLFCAES